MSLTVTLERSVFEPGEEVPGHVSWDLEDRPEAVVVRLCWRTSGRGTTDVRVVDEKRWVGPPAESYRPFQLRLPREPFSFSGQLISLTWTVEVVVEPSDASAHQDLVMAPGGREIVLAAVAK
jgi:hypothetical protein